MPQVITNDDLLFWWQAGEFVPRLGAHEPTFARTSVGSHQEYNGLLNPALAAGRPREEWVNLNGVIRRAQLVEPSRTNLLIRSETFDLTWTPGFCTVTANTAVAPDGTLTADKIIPTSGAQTAAYVYQTPASQADNTVLTASVFVKPAGWGHSRMYIQKKDGTYTYADFNLVTGASAAIGSGSLASGCRYIGDGWWRVWLTSNIGTGASPNTGTTFFEPTEVYGVRGGTGDGVKGAYFWGGQLEVGYTPSSYIPTTTATVSRAVETLYFNSAPDPQAMVVYASAYGIFNPPSGSGLTYSFWSISNGTKRFFCAVDVNGWYAWHHNGTAGVNNTQLGVSFTSNDFAEIVCILTSAGRVRVIVSKNEAPVSASALNGADNALASVWENNRIILGASDTAGTQSINAQHIDFKAVKYTTALSALSDQALMDEMRRYHVDGSSNLIAA